MSIELKIIITNLVMFLFTYIMAFPDTSFSKWGTKKFGFYHDFIWIILLIYTAPIVITILFGYGRFNFKLNE